jgi:hypothetical protein
MKAKCFSLRIVDTLKSDISSRVALFGFFFVIIMPLLCQALVTQYYVVSIGANNYHGHLRIQFSWDDIAQPPHHLQKTYLL